MGLKNYLTWIFCRDTSWYTSCTTFAIWWFGVFCTLTYSKLICTFSGFWNFALFSNIFFYLDFLVLHIFRRGSVSQSQIETQSNAYATISKLPMVPSSRRSLFNGSLDLFDHERDYATLDRSNRSPLGPVVPGITSTPLSYTLPRRDPRLASTDFGGSEYYLGGDGEPQIVGNLS